MWYTSWPPSLPSLITTRKPLARFCSAATFLATTRRWPNNYKTKQSEKTSFTPTDKIALSILAYLFRQVKYLGHLHSKILLLTYKILNGQSPSYLTSLISSYKPVRSLRSSDLLLLQVPNVMTATYGQRTFSYCAPKLWNSLPKSLKESETVTIFKKKLKTFLFRDYFDF